MKKIIALIVAVLFVFAVASISLAAEEKKMEPAKKEAAPAKAKAEKKVAAKVTQVTGEIKAVDAAAKTITVVKKVKGQDKETVISVDDKTLADVKVGDKVKAKYTTADGKNTAKSVIKKTAAAKKAAPAKKAPAAGY